MSNVTIKQLRYFEALREYGHFGRAAEACAITQPAMSLQITALETELNVILFERGPRHIRLTPFGEEFAVRAAAILRAVDELGDLARASHHHLVGRLRLGVIPTVAPYLLPKVVEDLMRHYAGLDLHLRETQTLKLLRELADGRLDAAIVALPVSEPSLAEVALFSEDFMLVRPKAEGSKPVPSIEALREMRLLLLEEGHCFRDQALAFCNMRSMRPREMLDASSLATLVQMVSAGIGVTLIPEMAVEVETHTASVSVARFGQQPPSRTIGMIWRKVSPLANHLENIAEIVRVSANSLRRRQAGGVREAK